MKEILGKCSKCGELITKTVNNVRSPRADNIGYQYTNEPLSNFFIFRCRKCHSVIHESFVII